MRLLKELDYQIVTIGELEHANDLTIAELERYGFYDDYLAEVEVYLTLAGDSFGWQNYGGNGHINVPALSLDRLRAFLGYERATLRDVLRHEYAHAVADTHRGLMRSRRFTEAYGRSHASEVGADYDKALHVTPYAAANPGEDFAEVFMKYLKHRGRMPVRFRTPAIREKWAFVEALGTAIRERRRRW